jgi:hypothetical protein
MAAMLHNNLVIGVFQHQADAEQAVADLWRSGFPRDRIDMVTRSQGFTKATPNYDEQKQAADGALTGAAAGAGAGAVAGAIAALFIPGLGAVLGSGLLLGALGGAALGAAGGTFLGPFIALQMSESQARHYARHVEEGRTLVLVQTDDHRDEARTILHNHGADERHDFREAVSAL